MRQRTRRLTKSTQFAYISLFESPILFLFDGTKITRGRKLPLQLMLNQSTPKFRNKNIVDEGGAIRLTFRRTKSIFAYIVLVLRAHVCTRTRSCWNGGSRVGCNLPEMSPCSAIRSTDRNRASNVSSSCREFIIPDPWIPRRISRRSLSIRDNTNHRVASGEWD